MALEVKVLINPVSLRDGERYLRGTGRVYFLMWWYITSLGFVVYAGVAYGYKFPLSTWPRTT